MTSIPPNTLLIDYEAYRALRSRVCELEAVRDRVEALCDRADDISANPKMAVYTRDIREAIRIR